MPPSKRSAQTARRDAIAATALKVLGERGSRHLTHRVIDSELELPAGSTSYYFNSRASLLMAASDALFRADKEDVAALQGMPAEASMETLLRMWGEPGERVRLLARLELFLEASRAPSLREHLLVQREFFRTRAVDVMARQGVDDPGLAADAAIARLEGELLRIAAFGWIEAPLP